MNISIAICQRRNEMNYRKYIIGFLLATTMSGSAFAADHEVDMLNKGADGPMVFEPMLSKIAIGDTITFVPKDKGHNAETIKKLMPEGSEPFKSKMNETKTYAFEKPGVYLIRCTPHYSMGMVALVIVGDDTSNLQSIKDAKLPKPARERVDKALSQL